MRSPVSRVLTLGFISIAAVLSCGRETPLEPMRASVSIDSFPPSNDFRDSASFAFPLPYSDTADLRFATVEPGEPTYFCHDSVTPPTRSVWYGMTANQPGGQQLTAQLFSGPGVLTVYAVHADTSGIALLPVGCSAFNQPVTFLADSGTSFYYQVTDSAGAGALTVFTLQGDTVPPPPPPPQANFGTYPYDPSSFDNTQFFDQSYDPGGVGFQSYSWSFGDGATASGYYVTHRYAADGDYTVVHTVTTYDGRTASISRVLQVRTHDVAITRFATPATGMTGRTAKITVDIRSNRYPETVQVQLFRSVPGGYQQVASSTQTLPTRNRVTTVGFTYTFAPDDAQIGKVTFRAVVSLLSARDALPADNEAIGPPTKVTR